MIRVIKYSHTFSFLKASIACLVSLMLAGCQPEGTGSVKGTAVRPSDGALGRPLGNEPEVKKKKSKAGSESEDSKKASELNPRL